MQTALWTILVNHVPWLVRYYVVLPDAGEFAAVGFSDFSSVTGAVSTFGFVFYVQPIMMPLLSEMPATERGVRILSWSTRVVVLGERSSIQKLHICFKASATKNVSWLS